MTAGDRPAAVALRPPSETAKVAAMCRAVNAIRGAEPKLLPDDVTRGLLGFADDQALLDHFDALPLSRYPGITTTFAVRARYAEDELAAAVAHGTTQYLIVGAVLDSFAHRRPDLMERLDVFEIDHPGGQAWTRQRVAELGLPVAERLHYVPADLAHDTLSDRLGEAGFDRSKPVFASMLGVSQYLTDAVLSQTLRALAALSNAGCTLVMEHIPPFSLLDEAERAPLERGIAEYAENGEPWLTFLTVDATATLLHRSGFARVSSCDHAALQDRYLRSRTTDRVMGRFVSFVRADTDASTVP